MGKQALTCLVLVCLFLNSHIRTNVCKFSQHLASLRRITFKFGNVTAFEIKIKVKIH